MDHLFKKLFIILALSAPLTILARFVETYIYSDWNFLLSLTILMVIDSALGFLNAWKQSNVSGEGFGKFFLKLALYGCLLITIHVIVSFNIAGKHPEVLDWLDDCLLTAMIVRESLSIFHTVALLRPGMVPKWILKRLENFDSDTGEKLPPDQQPNS